jgi:hypothetical protein
VLTLISVRSSGSGAAAVQVPEAASMSAVPAAASIARAIGIAMPSPAHRRRACFGPMALAGVGLTVIMVPSG